MIENDIYVRHNVCPVNTVKDLIGYVNRAFDASAGTAEEAILVLAAYCLFITYEEVYETFCISSGVLQKHVFPSLLKSGHLKKYGFSKNTGASRTFYAITSPGFKRAGELCRVGTQNRYKPVRKRQNGSRIYDYSAGHSYFAGYNLFSVLSLDLPFVWRREYPFTYGANYQGIYQKGELVVDARCTLFPGEGDKYRFLYFEEDTGYEHEVVLLDKLEKYRIYHLMDEDRTKDLVIFSFADKAVGAEANSRSMKVITYSTTKCQKLLKYVKDNGVKDVFTLLGNGSVEQDFLKAVLMVTGALKKKDGAFVRGTFTLTVDKLEEYYTSLIFRRNPYQHREFNIRHSALAFKRMERMAEIILSEEGQLPLYARQMAKGFPVYCMASTLVSDRLPFGLLSEFGDLKEKISVTLSSYFNDVRYESELSEPLTLSSRGDYVCLRNIYSYDIGNGSRGLTAIEFLSFDLSAWIRAALFLNYIKRKEGTPVQFICVFESTEHYIRFFRLLKFCSYDLCLISDESNIFGLMLYNVGKEHKIFTNIDDKNPEAVELTSAFRSDEE